MKHLRDLKTLTIHYQVGHSRTLPGGVGGWDLMMVKALTGDFIEKWVQFKTSMQ